MSRSKEGPRGGIRAPVGKGSSNDGHPAAQLTSNDGARKRVTTHPKVDDPDLDPIECDTEELQQLVHRMLELIGEDPTREGLVRTPLRVARSLAWLTRGYDLDVADVVGEGVFEEGHENMILVRDIELYSLCEHHMLPFFGKAHIAYIPNARIVGLSKLPRIVEMFAAACRSRSGSPSRSPRRSRRCSRHAASGW